MIKINYLEKINAISLIYTLNNIQISNIHKLNYEESSMY